VETASEPRLVTLQDIRDAAARLVGIAVRTPLLRFGRPIDGDPLGRTRAWLKPENLQPIGAFKIRGAYNAIAQLSDDARRRGVVAHSSGNHAQGVARAARLLGVPAVIVMPSDAPRAKVAGVTADGASIVVVGPSSEERAQRAERMARDEGLTLIAPFDDAAVIAGQGTIGLEIVDQVAELDEDVGLPRPLTVLVPVGGGGIASGVSTAVKTLRPDARVFGVEPALAADAEASLRAGRIVRWDPADVGRTMADGMRTASLSRLTFAHLRRHLDGILTVEEDEIPVAMARAASDARMVLEPSGATTLAAFLHRTTDLPAEGWVVCILSGGNVDPERFAALVATATADPVATSGSADPAR
jgi:threonine dehydratase